MAEIRLTAEQQAVVENRGGNLLVSAAAGSGKTRVLVERLFRYVEERENIDDFLIITYTRAAAAELRSRIAEELSQRLAADPRNQRLQSQLYRIYRADIKTVDSFCTALLRENVHLLEEQEGHSLSADFRVLEENEAELLRRKALRDVLEQFYTRLEPADELLADTLGFGRDDRSLEELVLMLHAKLQSHAWPEKWIEESSAFWEALPERIDQTPYAALLLAGVRRRAEHWSTALRRAVTEMEENEAVKKGYSGSFLSAAGQLDTLAAATQQGWEETRQISIVFPRLGAVKNDAGGDLKLRLKTLWDLCKKTWKEALVALSSEEAMEDLEAVAPAMGALLRLTKEFSHAYSMEKLRRNVTDFSDQEHFAVKLLVGEDGAPTELCQRIGARYREIMVDEYQDTNEVQNTIFEALAAQRHNLFSVGDVKQSIYRFRLADPGIFLDKYKRFTQFENAEEGEDRKILLSKNFRSRSQVLEAANFAFENLLSEEMGEMAYGEEERLYCGADYYPVQDGCAAEFHLLDVERGGERFSAGRALMEARFVAKKVADMLEQGYPVYDGELKAMRKCRPGDFAVLMRSPGPRLPLYTQAFRERGIPCATTENEDFFAQMEIAVTFSILQIIDNPRQDVPLISALRSPVFGFTPDRLAQIRGKWHTGDFYDALLNDNGEDSKAFLSKLCTLRFMARDMSVHGLLWRIYDELCLLGVFGAMSAGELRCENLITLYEYARGFERNGYRGLFAFINHLRQLLERGEQPMNATGSVGESVQVMSIHKSKGLEFPIVILADLSKDFNQMDYRSGVLVHPRYGLGPVRVDLERRISYPTVARQAVEEQLRREGKSEELRVLYVAMTRAKEKLIMVSSMIGGAKRLEKLVAQAGCPVAPSTVAEAKSMAEWILLPLLCRMEAKSLWDHCGMVPGQTVLCEDERWSVAVHQAEGYLMPPVAVSEEKPEETGQRTLPVDETLFAFRYSHTGAVSIPSKVTATQMKGRFKDEEVSDGAERSYEQPVFSRPAFLEQDKQLTAAQRGTIMHAALQYIDFSCTDIDFEIEKLVRAKKLTVEEGGAVDREKLKTFLASSLADEIRGAKQVWREYRFSVLTDAFDYFGKPGEGEEVMLQGVVDCFFETEEGLTVVDFKTDRVSKKTIAERTERYRSQVEAYCDALERIFEKRVCRRILYYFHTGEMVEL